jgi:TPP-dependent pyruvate/acetoin dehydrogenase alpha subunit
VSGVSKKKASATYENPLIPHARLRQMYRAMLHARMLEKALPASSRGRGIGEGAVSLGIAGLEACLVSSAVSLEAGDLVSDAVGGGVVEFLRGAALGEVLDRGKGKSRRQTVTLDCGAAMRLAGAQTASKRMWSAIGAGLALKAAGERDKKSSATRSDEAATERQLGVVVVYVRPGEAKNAVWRSALQFVADEVLPMLFVVLPPTSAETAGELSRLSQKCGVPGIAVDGADAVAIYRVAQESVVRARMGGGAALLECVPFAVEGAKAKSVDAIAALERYMLDRGVAKQVWMEHEAKAFAKVLAAAKAG